MSKKSLIDSIQIKSPCSEDWNAMKGGDKVRFCGHCDLNVNNISALTRKQAMKLVRDSDGRICVRYIKNPVDNKPLFADRLYKITRRAGIAAGVLGASLALSTLTYAQGAPVLLKRNPDAQTKTLKEKDSDKDKTESRTGSISGTLIDQQDAVIPNFKITLTNQKTGQIQTTTTNSDGYFEFRNIDADVYSLKSEGKDGFKAKEIKEITVRAAEDLRQDIELDIELVTVMGDIAIVSYRSLLHQAVSNGDLEEVKNLIANGENINQKDENYGNITPLFIAVENGSADIAETLLNFGARVNAKDENKQTPLMRLDEDASLELVNLLIKHGAKVNLVDREGNNALIFAARSAKAEVLQVLIRRTTNIDAQNSDGRTALMEAADADNFENVRALLLAGADLNLKDREGETALDLTTENKIEELLKAYGATVSDN